MARNSGGTYSLPTGQPVVSSTTISSSIHNALASDVAAELTDSLSRTGKGGMSAALRGINGTAAAPSFAFTNDTGVGAYRSASGEGALAAGGAAVAKWTSAGFFASLIQALTAVVVTIMGRAPNGGTAVGVVLDTEQNFTTAGAKLVSFRNATVEKAYIDKDGSLVSYAPTAAATPGSNWDIGAGTGSHEVRKVAGVVTVAFQAIATGAGAATIMTLPAGYRPATDLFGVAGSITDNSSGLVYPIFMQVQASGAVLIDYYDNGTSLVVTGTAPLSNIAVSDAVRATLTFVAA